MRGGDPISRFIFTSLHAYYVSLVHDFIISHLDYDQSLLIGLPAAVSCSSEIYSLHWQQGRFPEAQLWLCGTHSKTLQWFSFGYTYIG